MFVRCIPLLSVLTFCWTMAAQCENHVVVVGGGLAGLSAAVEAIIDGAKVMCVSDFFQWVVRGIMVRSIIDDVCVYEMLLAVGILRNNGLGLLGN